MRHSVSKKVRQVCKFTKNFKNAQKNSKKYPKSVVFAPFWLFWLFLLKIGVFTQNWDFFQKTAKNDKKWRKKCKNDGFLKKKSKLQISSGPVRKLFIESAYFQANFYPFFAPKKGYSGWRAEKKPRQRRRSSFFVSAGARGPNRQRDRKKWP